MTRIASGGLFGVLARVARRVVRNVRYRKSWDAGTILHSEWDRRLGVCTLLAIGLAMTLALAYYVVLPCVFAETLRGGLADAPSPPLIGFAIAALLIVLSTHQLAWIARQLPRGCALYNFAYAGCGQAAAFFIAWSQLFDAAALVAILSQAYGEHFRLLFLPDDAPTSFDSMPSVRRVIRFARPSASAAAAFRQLVHLDTIGGVQFDTLAPVDRKSPFDWSPIDWLSLAAVAFAALCLLCSLRVLLTATVIFLIAALFTSASTTIVALLHNLPLARVNQLADDLPRLVEQTLANVPHFLVGFLAVELLGQLGDECADPRVAVPLAARHSARAALVIGGTTLLSYFPFVYSIQARTEMPTVSMFFDSIGVHSAKYLMNVSAICALSAALLCGLLPLSRLLAALGADALLPAGDVVCRLYGRGGTPRVAVALSAAAVAALTIAGRSTAELTALLSLNLCGRLFVMAILVYLSTFRADADNPETAAVPLAYERIRHRRSQPSVCVWEDRQRHARNKLRIKNGAGVPFLRFDSISSPFSSTASGLSADDLSESSSLAFSDGDGSTDSESGGMNETRFLERIWQLANCENGNTMAGTDELRGLRKKYTPTTVRLSVTTDQLSPRLVRLHNCLSSPCASNYALGAPPERNSVISIRSSSFHIYDTNRERGAGASSLRIVAFPRRVDTIARRVGRAGVHGAEERERSARRALATFVVAAALVAVAHHIIWRTTNYVSLPAIIAAVASLLLLIAAGFHVYCIGADVDEERAFTVSAPSVAGCRTTPAYGSFASNGTAPITTVVGLADSSNDSQSVGWLAASCLTTVAIVSQLFGQFNSRLYAQLALYYLAGGLLYLTQICGKRKVRL